MFPIRPVRLGGPLRAVVSRWASTATARQMTVMDPPKLGQSREEEVPLEKLSNKKGLPLDDLVPVSEETAKIEAANMMSKGGRVERTEEAADYDPSDLEIENQPHSWEKAILKGHAVPSDEFARKNFILKAYEVHPHNNLYIQIIVQSLEEARAEDIVVIDVSNKHLYFPHSYDHFHVNGAIGQRKMDTIIHCSGKTARHIELIGNAVANKIRKGLLPGEFSRKSLTVDQTLEEVFWEITVYCGKIAVIISHPMRRDWRMKERRAICQRTADANIFVEDMLKDGGWIKLWDHWTPISPSNPKTEYEYVYCQERAHGWERVDTLKPEYIVTANDELRRHGSNAPTIFDTLNLENPSQDDWETVRTLLRDRKRALQCGSIQQPEGVEQAVEKEIESGERYINFQYDNTLQEVTVSDEEVEEWFKNRRRDLEVAPRLRETPEEKEERDREWADYMRRREARIRRFGYYDYVELQNDLARGVVILPSGPYTWDGSGLPKVRVQPHPENYKGKPRDTKWGPGWYDV